MSYNIAVIGATERVGKEIIQILAERKFPVNSISALCHGENLPKNKKISFGDEDLTVSLVEDYDFDEADICFFAAGAKIAKKYIEAASSKAVVIDNSSCFRLEKDVPLIIPDVNIEELSNYKNRNIVSSPNCVSIPLVTVLKPLHELAQIKRVVVSTYQSVSGEGKSSMDELYQQIQDKLFNKEIKIKEFPRQIAFNVIPQIDTFTSEGDTREENRVVEEARKILGKEIEVTATCVRVPVFVGHAISVNVEFNHDISAGEAKEVLGIRPEVMITDEADFSQYSTPLDCIGQHSILLSRIRDDISAKNALNMWVVSDNLKRGAALNVVQIAEELVKCYI